MFDIVKYFNSFEKYQHICDEISKHNNSCILNTATNIQKLLILNLFQKYNKTIVVVYPNIYEATIAYEDYLELGEAEKISFFPVEDLVASELIASSNTYRLDRIKTLFKVINGIPQIIVTTPEGLTRNIINKQKLKDSVMNLQIGNIYKRDDLIKGLVTRGYQKASIVDVPGTFSVRGSVIDIYAINNESPIRIDFFDDEIENIKEFDVSTQRSVKSIKNTYIYPFYDILYKEEDIPEIKNRIVKTLGLNEKTLSLQEQIDNYYNLDQLYLYLPLIDEHTQVITELIEDKCLIFSNIHKILEKEKQNYSELFEYMSDNKITLNSDFFKNTLEIIHSNNKNVFFESFSTLYEEIKCSYTVDLESSNNIDYTNYLTHMIEEFNLNQEKTYIITHYDQSKLKLISDLLENNNIKYIYAEDETKIKKDNINLVVSSNSLGYVDYGLGIEVVTPKQFARGKIYKTSKYQKEINKTVQIYNKEDLVIGDFVVHQDYGIGKYLGIKTIENKKIKNDYLIIEYAENGKLYIPVEKVYRLQKYIGSFDKNPKLTKLNTKEWEKKKARVKEKLIQIAKDLIKTQAKRELMQGFVYQKDSPEQLAFENDFEYTETLDQIKAVEEIKKDMESTRPVDRLICGDVGFGKTEVALRIAFKAVDNGKQVAVLAPTTVLSRQHYYTFKERCEKYGIRVELLNRFIDKKDTDKVIEGLKKGYVDIVIGTHKLLSDNVKFKDLGLLVIDEEQRFGVTHKEKIKQLKANIDVISMSATPIPRTLQMSLSGLKEMSLIETPPVNRKSVQTYVLKTNESVIREAIYREMARGGQVFYLLNKIAKLDSIASKVKRLVPKAHVGIIHGQMQKDDIEEVLNDFLDKKYDVLVCTTIVETGIDIPNANTLIIEQADHLGLAQLYQIRGRVGRSEQVAYAYLMYDNDLTLSDVAQKRLNAIKEFTSLGSGYKIAMRDLSIRGAGDILGSEQSGFIDDIGVDLYMQMLEEAVNEQKGIIKEEEKTFNFDLSISKTIDNTYVDEDILKIAMHQEISKIFTKEQAEAVIQEFTDRYGKVYDSLKVYIYSKYLETLLKKKGIERYKTTDKTVELNFDEEHTAKIPYIYFLKTAKTIAPMWNYEYKHKKIHITICISEDNKLYGKNSYIYKLIEFMENL